MCVSFRWSLIKGKCWHKTLAHLPSLRSPDHRNRSRIEWFSVLASTAICSLGAMWSSSFTLQTRERRRLDKRRRLCECVRWCQMIHNWIDNQTTCRYNSKIIINATAANNCNLLSWVRLVWMRIALQVSGFCDPQVAMVRQTRKSAHEY